MQVVYPYLGPCLVIATLGVTIAGGILAWSWGAVLRGVAHVVREEGKALVKAGAHVLEAGVQAAEREDPDSWIPN